MRIDLAPEDLVFREEVRAFLREKLPPDIKRKVDNGVSLRRDDIMRWHRILYERGWVAPNWPAEWGGPGWTIERKYIWDAEQGLAGAPRLISFGINMCGRAEEHTAELQSLTRISYAHFCFKIKIKN